MEFLVQQKFYTWMDLFIWRVLSLSSLLLPMHFAAVAENLVLLLQMN